MDNKENKRNISLDLLRILACVMVIMIHTSAQNWYTTKPASFEWQVFNVYDSLVRSAVPILLMISGVFFLDNNKTIKIKSIYIKYIFRLIVAYVFWSLFYAVINKSNLALGFSKETLKLIINNIILANHYHLWYLPTMISIYILVPIFRSITRNDENKNILRYFILLFFMFGILKSTINLFDNLIKFQHKELINGIMNTIPIDLRKYYGYFLLGYYLMNTKYNKRILNIYLCLGILGVISCIFITSLYSLHTGEQTADAYDYFIITTFFESIAIFCFFKEKINNMKFSINSEKMIRYLSSCTFGIYLIHPFILQSLDSIGLNTMKFNPIISTPAIMTLTFVISFFIISIIKKIPIMNKYIV